MLYSLYFEKCLQNVEKIIPCLLGLKHLKGLAGYTVNIGSLNKMQKKKSVNSCREPLLELLF